MYNVPLLSSDVKCSRSVDFNSISFTIQDIDYQLHTILNSIPPAIEEARWVFSLHLEFVSLFGQSYKITHWRFILCIERGAK